MKPSAILNDTTSHTLILTWADGAIQNINHGTLRAACQCAFCRSYRLKDEIIPENPLQLITEIHSHGYGLQLVFDDGHDRGIYPWQYLRSIN